MTAAPRSTDPPQGDETSPGRGGGPFVGTDVVDLADPRTADRHSDARFLQRVFTSSEQELICNAAAARCEVWSLWAAKEAAYKVASKLRGSPPVFAHSSFAVIWHDCGEGVRRGAVSYDGTVIPVDVSWDRHRVHALAVSVGAPSAARWGMEQLGDSTLEELLPRLSPRERDPVHSQASAAVRLAARPLLARILEADEGRVEIVCEPGVTGRRPPHVLLDGRAAPVDVSLSHHGAWLAWAALAQNHSGR